MCSRPIAPLLLLLSLPPAACGPSPPDRPPDRVTLTPTGFAPADLVARVNGAPILRQDLQAQMIRGQGRDEALQALIKQELLAQEAARRGLARDSEVLQARRRAMVNLLVKREFRAAFTPRDVPRELIEAAYELNKKRYVHEEAVKVYHIIAIADRRHNAAFHARARRLVDKVHASARSRPMTPDEFRAIAPLVSRADPMVTLRAEGPFMQGRVGRLDPGFMDEAFKLNKPGEISPVFQTGFGYHVIYLAQRLPAINVPLRQVEDEIRTKVFDQARGQAFTSWLAQLQSRHQAVLLGAGGAGGPATVPPAAPPAPQGPRPGRGRTP